MKRLFSKIGPLFLLLTISISWSNCSSNNTSITTPSLKTNKIVSLSGTTTEILCALGFEAQIIGTDISSTYPESISKLPKVGHNRNISSEGIIALNPTLVVGMREGLKPELISQLNDAHIRVLLFNTAYSIAGTKALIQEMAKHLEAPKNAAPIINTIDQDLQEQVALPKKPKVLFIYARGAGTMMVAGKNTPVNAIIELAGATNAVSDFEDFKPLTAESLLKANPDVLLMFNSGLESLGGMDGLLKVPGVAMTKAGKNKKVIEMDGLLLTGFGPRLGKAIAILSKQLDAQ